MKSRILSRWLFALATGFFLIFQFSAAAQQKRIKLRNETIVTEAPTKASRAADRPAKESPAAGLFLIQFTGPIQTEWEQQLKSMGVDLLRYVPDDAFIVKFDGARPGLIRNLEFVQWVGPYKSEHKIHGKLKNQLNAAARGTPSTNVLSLSLMFSPRATGSEIAEIRRLFKSTKQESHLRQGTILKGSINPAQLAAIANSSSVLWIEPGPKMKLMDEISTKIVAGDDGVAGTQATTHQLGFTGAGVTVAVADSGLNNGDAATMHPDLFGRVTAFFHYGNLVDAADEHSHGTHVAGIIAGNAATGETDESGYLYGLGVAPEAHIVAQRIFDGAGGYEPPASFETLTRDAVDSGADIGSNSWGDDTQGRYDISAAEFDELVRDADALTFGDQPYILEFSAGNAGPGLQTIGSPAVAKNVIASGATESTREDFIVYGGGPDVMADFSSRGPCEDGRIKPDVTAPGTWIASLKSASATDENAWSPISENYMYQGGTSQSGPHVSGAAAVFVQYYRSQHTNATPSPAMVKAALIDSAVNMDDEFGGTAPVPNEDEGWGRVDLTEIIGSPRYHDYIDQTTLLSSGQIFERRTFVQGSDEAFKVTMDYTDVPGFPGAIPALVNDLDLEVVGPDGAIYRGNQFDAGESVPNAPSPDSINNVEAVRIAQPMPGEYIVRVRARSVVQDSRVETGAIDQDFALVISGDIPLPGQGVIFLDRGAYTAPSQIKIKVVDSDRAGQPSVTSSIRSTTETTSENITLLASGSSGVFTGAVATVVGSAVADGKLQIHNGDLIEAFYQDVSAGVTRSDTAQADLVPPVLTGISVTNEFNRMVIQWTSGEPANAVVRYSTNFNFNLSATNSALTSAHTVPLDGLIPGVTYRFYVSSTDEAGNTATNNNAGAYYTFVAATNTTVLLVDAYVSDTDSQTIPVTAYTDALSASGISYNIWDVSLKGSPQLADLRSFPVVIWRVSDSIYTSSSLSSLSAAQQTAIQNYINGGGSFFMSSMEILSRLGDVPFRRNVFQVAGFSPNPDPFSLCEDCDEDVGVPSVMGVASDPVTSGINMDLDYSAYPIVDFFELGPDFSDTFSVSTNAAPILISSESGRTAGMRYPKTGQDSTGRVVFCSFPLDTMPVSGTAPNNRASFLRNVISFLVPGVNGLGTIALDNAYYKVPSLITVEVGDSDRAGLGQTQVAFSSSSFTNPVTVTLNETTRRGLFRGFITLIPTNAVPAANQLRANDGDIITAKYFDASANGNVQATALVDTQVPVLSGVTAEASYEDAVVSWTSSEAGDSLVQYGESALLGRTSYDPVIDTDHQLVLTGLTPNKLYYYQVVTRDAAGNTVVDDNNGQFYTFQTLTPLHPPFFDNLENSGTNWSVIDADGTEVSWQLGVPNNGVETSAHSPMKAWGSNLNGASTDEVESFLVSPAIDLTGGNQATLQFWHSYDFSELTEFDIVETGDLMIITNSYASPVTLTTYGDFTSGWEQETIDLSAYAGHVVYLVWHYVQFSLDPAPRPGWLVDDISVTVNNIVPGTIRISNNLAQAQFVLTGPVNRNGLGNLTVITNAPPGQYAISFSNVPYYQTPPSQTNTLTSSTTLLFQGNYTIVDSNANGMSDAWEQQFFGSVSGSRTRLTDTDGDGFTDYAEFIAGTNPTNAVSKLSFMNNTLLGNGSMQLQWSSVPGRVYRVETSTNLTTWTPVSDWIQATAGTSLYTVPSLSNGPHMYRVQVRP